MSDWADQLFGEVPDERAPGRAGFARFKRITTGESVAHALRNARLAAIGLPSRDHQALAVLQPDRWFGVCRAFGCEFLGPPRATEASAIADAEAHVRGAEAVVVLIDDVRWFRDGRPCRMARSSAAGISLLTSLRGQRIRELWLDHDLGGDDTVMPVVDLLCEQRFDIETTYIHSFNARGAVAVKQRLTAADYAVQHHYDVRVWTHEDPRKSDPGATLPGEGGRS